MERYLRTRREAAVSALATLARATPDDAASALRLLQDRTGKSDSECLVMLDQLEHEIMAVPEGTAVAFAAAEVPLEPSPQLQLYMHVLLLLDAVWEMARREYAGSA
jgi:hypothetical protein